MRDILRTVRLRPYRRGAGPTFSLMTYDTHRTDYRGQTIIGYEFKEHHDGKTTVIFAGEDFAGSPLHADDADETIASLLNFLTLRPGDTDREYFANYTETQTDFATYHAETLSAYVDHRFGEN